MSSSISIPTRTAYAESSKAGSSSSSSSSYSTSPQTPEQQTKTSPQTSVTKSGHDRRPSLLSEYSLSPLLFPTKLAAHLGIYSHGALHSLQIRLYYSGRTVADIISGSSLLKQEHTVINIGDPDGPPRLVSHGPDFTLILESQC
jgi:hypothetical protein